MFNPKLIIKGFSILALTLLLILALCGTIFGEDWPYRKEITIDHTKIATNLTNFPVLINFSSDPDLAIKAQEDGDDIVFTSDDGSTKLDHEIESCGLGKSSEPFFDNGHGYLYVLWRPCRRFSRESNRRVGF